VTKFYLFSEKNADNTQFLRDLKRELNFENEKIIYNNNTVNYLIKYFLNLITC
jgi:hypothetical protein